MREIGSPDNGGKILTLLKPLGARQRKKNVRPPVFLFVGTCTFPLFGGFLFASCSSLVGHFVLVIPRFCWRRCTGPRVRVSFVVGLFSLLFFLALGCCLLPRMFVFFSVSAALVLLYLCVSRVVLCKRPEREQ